MLRNCYTVDARLTPDGPVERLRWYWLPDDADPLPYDTVFLSGHYLYPGESQADNVVGEISDRRKFSSGARLFGLDTGPTRGDPAWFRDGIPADVAGRPDAGSCLPVPAAATVTAAAVEVYEALALVGAEAGAGAGLAAGAEVVAVPDPTKAGTEVYEATATAGAEVVAVPDPTKAGTEVYEATATAGAIQHDNASPGSSCSGAGSLTLGISESGTFSGLGQQHWWRFGQTSGTTYHVVYTVTSGSGFPSGNVQHGSCSGPTQIGLISPNGCLSWTASSSDEVQIRLLAPVSGSGSYTILADTGSCP